jgi:ABC-2 type transport system ATP-binding protein
MIKFDGLTKVFSKKLGPAIDSVSFEVADGEIVGFVGLNGAGKTTTIRIAAGVALPTSGSASMDGYDLVASKIEASKRVGWVPEIPNFEPNAYAISLMEYFAGFYGIPAPEAKRRAHDLLNAVGLADSETKKIREYSQGMKKRFALGVSMLGDPKNYLFDEVLNGLDPAGIHYFRQLMVELKKEGKAVLLSSHILVEVEGISDRIVFIHKGKLIRTITKAELAAVGGTTVKVVIDNLDDNAISFLKGKGDVSLEGNTVHLSWKGGDAAQLNSDLLRMGYKVSEFSFQKEGLEEYFLRLIGGAR